MEKNFLIVLDTIKQKSFCFQVEFNCEKYFFAKLHDQFRIITIVCQTNNFVVIFVFISFHQQGQVVVLCENYYILCRRCRRF